jgi:hypothetical protein
MSNGIANKIKGRARNNSLKLKNYHLIDKLRSRKVRVKRIMEMVRISHHLTYFTRKEREKKEKRITLSVVLM